MKLLMVGRSPENDICLNDVSVSRKHLKIAVDDKVLIEDLGSVNGTFVNGKPVKFAYITPQDTVRLGNVTLNTAQLFVPQNTSTTEKKIDKTIYSNEKNVPQTLKTISVGRAADNDIVLGDTQISAHHANFYIDGNNIILEDKNSTNGTFINKRRVTRSNVTLSDTIYFGNFKFSLEAYKNLLEGKAKISEQDKPIKIKEGINRIGRADDNDIVIKHPMISSHHAIIRKSNEILEIEDINSLNGVFINGKKVTKSRITYDDVINLGIYPLRLSEQKIIRAYESDNRIDLVNLSFAVNDKGNQKVIINDISLTIYPTEFVGLIGPSGSGKTTLLNLMNGYSMPTTGEVIVNSFNLHRNQNLFRGMIGFVPQDDIIHRELTVFESLYFSAKLRLPSDSSEKEIEDRVNDIIEKLELTRAKNVIIGSPEKRGISGGQRKRVNLAQELITQPTILFMDEPTSGLDPRSDNKIMRLLRSLANEGRIVILTTHHISTENFKLFDNIVLLSKGGKVAFYGPSYPDSLQYFNVDDPKEIFDEIETKAEKSDPSAEYKQSNYFEEFVSKRKLTTDNRYKSSSEQLKKSKVSSVRQLFIFLKRLIRIKISDKANTMILLLQSPILAFLIALTLNLPKNMRMDTDFLNPLNIMVITAVFFGIINTSREIVSERAIYMRERKVFLKIPPYLFSKFALLSFISFVQSFFLVVIIHSLCDLHYNIVNMIMIVFLTSVVSMCFGLFISSVAKSPDSAISLSIFALIPQIIYAGAVVPLGKMNSAVKIISNFCITRWSFESLLIKEARVRPDFLWIQSDTTKMPPKLDSIYISMTDYLRGTDIEGVSHDFKETRYMLENASFNFNMIMLAAWGVFFLLLVVVLLKMRDRIK
ncbi:MAG TPA: FHA domain-containing protein [Ignavibacteria bacterium]